MDEAALAGAIGGPAVGVVAIFFTWLHARGGRKHDGELADKRRHHELALADKQHAHDRQRAHDDRLFERRSRLYEEIGVWAQMTMFKMDHTRS